MSLDVMRCTDAARQSVVSSANAIKQLADRFDTGFVTALRLILNCRGHLVTTGVGKSGIAAAKIAATFASTGVRSLFLHAGDASHGDLGMVGPSDVVLAISNSGETEEVARMVPYLERHQIPLIAFVGNRRSSLACRAHCALDVSVEREADPSGLIPTCSTLVQLAMGDALALAVMAARQPTLSELAELHPGGVLGARLREANARLVELAPPKLAEVASR
jgi:arabinose-5-phosphate isomerase